MVAACGPPGGGKNELTQRLSSGQAQPPLRLGAMGWGPFCASAECICKGGSFFYVEDRPLWTALGPKDQPTAAGPGFNGVENQKEKKAFFLTY